jgi:hypothetical protein
MPPRRADLARALGPVIIDDARDDLPGLVLVDVVRHGRAPYAALTYPARGVTVASDVVIEASFSTVR